MKKIIILGSVSYILDHAKVGINWIGEYLSDNGYNVTYVSSASTPLDLFSKKRRRRFLFAWCNGGKREIKKNLVEVVFKAPWILNRINSSIMHKYANILQRNLLSQQYDILISTVGSLALFADSIKADKKILRLQDSPHDFGISCYNITYFESLLRKNTFDQIWSVSKQLKIYSEQLSSVDNYYLPNGARLSNFIGKTSISKAKKAIYFGAFTDWVDVKLIIRVAKILPDWQFDLYGEKLEHDHLPSNVMYYGPIKNELIPDLLLNYSVGLIPFKNCKHIDVVERPLKFYQYLAAGLGIASVSFGGLKDGMGEWACYGNTPEEYAHAIEGAFGLRSNYNQESLSDFLNNSSWEFILPKFMNLIEE